MPENTTGGGQSFSFNTTQEQAEAAVAEAQEAIPPPAPPAPASVTTTAPAAPVTVEGGIEVGSKVEARYAGGTTWYFAHVVAISEDGK